MICLSVLLEAIGGYSRARSFLTEALERFAFP
jgi:hypothetical protein